MNISLFISLYFCRHQFANLCTDQGYADEVMFAEAVLVATETERRAMLRKHYTQHDPQLNEAFKEKETKTQSTRKEGIGNKTNGKKRENEMMILKKKDVFPYWAYSFTYVLPTKLHRFFIAIETLRQQFEVPLPLYSYGETNGSGT